MPDLPTLTVTQTQADRMLAAFGNATNYRAWLKQQIINYVREYEIIKDDEQYAATRQAKRAQIETDLT